MARVLWRDAQGNEGSLDLETGEALIGRALDCLIRTDDAMVSRHHARVVGAGGGQFYVEDLGSANGVYYQEQRVQRHSLSHGDAVRCGSLWLRFIDTGPSPQAAPPAAHQAPPPAAHPPPAAQPPPAAPPPAAAPAAPAGDPEEVRRLQRRIDQLQAELRMYRGKGNAAAAKQFEDLENEHASLEEERDMLKSRVRELEATLEAESGDVKVRRASQIAHKAGEAVSSLNDVLSNLRINIMAAEGEFEQYASAIPRASFELIREALRSSAADMESARELLRKLREISD